MGHVANKIAIVTGAAAGIGRATALALAREGACVVATDIEENGARSVVAEMASSCRRHMGLTHDVGDEASWQGIVDAVLDEFGRLDILVNNAGIGISQSLLDTSLANWRAVLRTNLDGVFLGTRMGVEAMRSLPSRPRRSPGSIINLSSIAGLVGLPEGAAYCASKGGVRLLTKTVALECATKGWQVRVNSVHPGFIETPMNQATLKRLAQAAGTDVETQHRLLSDLHPIGRMGTADEIAAGILYLASDESGFMTGAELVLDGGYTAR
jgi:NAD(P)-dependent dehydrogenase (short-subunit alcohol dehydrogenase family)